MISEERAMAIIGRKFGKLLATGMASRSEKGTRRVSVKCDCGVEKTVGYSDLLGGKVKSCGCSQRDRGNGHLKRIEYRCWVQMKWRCGSPTAASYKLYGGRGITVCDRWQESFENFLSDMGPRPSLKYSLDRIDVNGNYEPGNCRWATATEQMGNTRSNQNITLNGVTLCAREWARRLGLQDQTIYRRLKKGLSPDKVLAPTKMSAVNGERS